MNAEKTKQISKSDVYDAINMYFNNGNHKSLKNHYEGIYREYIRAGGEYSLQEFFDTIDDYNMQGHCGY